MTREMYTSIGFGRLVIDDTIQDLNITIVHLSMNETYAEKLTNPLYF